MATALQADTLTKSYGGVQVLHNGTLQLEPGVITGLVGENGAGKSTLLSICAGLTKPDSGALTIAGQTVGSFSPTRLLDRHRTALVPQEIDLCRDRTVAENVVLGREGSIWPRATELVRVASDALAEVGIDVDPRAPLRNLRPSEQQMVLVARALGRGCDVMMFDEPTANLTPPEADRLHELMHKLAAAGKALLYVTHHLPDVIEHCGSIVVMRNGGVCATHASTVTEDQLVTDMIGAGRSPHRRSVRRRTLDGKTGLTLSEWETAGVAPTTLTVARGSVVGLAGLPDSGRAALLRSLADPYRTRGNVEINGRPVRLRSPKSALDAGIGYVPSERRSEGAFLDMSVADNVCAPMFGSRLRGLFQSAGSRRRRSADVKKAARVKGELQQHLRHLSGGNQQKAIIARFLGVPLNVLLLDEPTRGVDIDAKRNIHEHIHQVADSGAAVLVSSSDVPELLELCDRILVMRKGRIVGDLDASDADEEAVLAPALRDLEPVSVPVKGK